MTTSTAHHWLLSHLPVTTWLPRYRWRDDLTADLVAGIALAALLIPESMGYAGVAGVPAEAGLYAALGAVVAYAVLGGTSVLVVGPASAVAALSASIVAEFRDDVDPVVLTSALAMTSGVLLIAAGVLRLGWIVNFISRPVLEAFVVGLSISIIIGQLDGLLGIEVDGTSAVAKLVDVVSQLGDVDRLSFAIGGGAVLALVLLERYAARVPAAVVVVALGIALVVVFDLDEDGLAVVGDIPQGLPSLSIPDVSGTRWLELFAGATALLLVGFSEGYASASAVAKVSGEEIDANQELIASGGANITSGLVGGLAVGGSLSKSSASQNAGARSQVANLVAGALVLATLLFLAPVFEELPEPVLAAVVVAALLRSANPRRVAHLLEVNRLDFVAGAATFGLVLLWETLPAMIVGVVLSLAFVVRRASFPDVVELERDEDGAFRRIDDVEGSRVRDGVLIVRFDGPLIYANAERLRQFVRALVARSDPGLDRVVLDAEVISDLDTTGGETLAELDDELAGRSIELRLARLHARVRDQVTRSHLAERFADRVDTHLLDASSRPSGRPGVPWPEAAERPLAHD